MWFSSRKWLSDDDLFPNQMKSGKSDNKKKRISELKRYILLYCSNLNDVSPCPPGRGCNSM